MTSSVRLRPWQRRALDRLAASTGPDFLAVATPGAGKTTFALTAARLEARPGGWRRLVVVVPTQHLKVQWADAAARFGLHLEAAWSPSDGLPDDVHGVVVTYQQVAQSAAALAALGTGAFVVFDEIHHAGDDRAWGSGVRLAFAGARRRLALSGTPFRSDTRAIPFVTYRVEEAVPDFEYGYGDALAEGGVVRPVWFPRLNGEMEWSAPDGSLYSATFDDPLSRQLANQRLRTALSLEGEWLPAVLEQADGELRRLRGRDAGAGGLVIAMDQDHARGIAGLLRERFGARAVVATSDDPIASQRIARFAGGDTPWIVAVRMVSEGVDIPRLRVGVFATNTTTELFFRQAVGRLVRWTSGATGGSGAATATATATATADGEQRAVLFIPDDVRLRTFAHGLAEQRRHTLRRRHEDAAGVTDPGAAGADPDGADDADARLDEPRLAGDDSEQLSLFAALSATPLGMAEPIAPALANAADAGADLEVSLQPLPPGPWRQSVPTPSAWPASAPGWPAAPPVPSVAPNGGANGGAAPVDARRERLRLRELNGVMAAEVVRATGLPHARVNAELNRLAGVGRVTEATVVQLERRVDEGRRWLDRLRRRG